MKIHAVQGAGGIQLHVREWGNPAGIPILLVHGWSQSHLCWMKQQDAAPLDEFRVVAFDLRGHGMSEGRRGHVPAFDILLRELDRFRREVEGLAEFRLVAYDLRGHGMSDAPLQAEQYADGDRWADDVAAIIDRLGLTRPILVGSSYGGFIIGDFIRKHGQDRIAGINFVGTIVGLGPKDAPLIGPGFLENAPGMCTADLPTRIGATRRFVHALFARPIPAGDLETVLAFNMAVDPRVRAFLMQRDLDYAAVLESIRVPVLITQGRLDLMVRPAMADRIREHCKTGHISWYNDVGHAPFLEEPDRFNRELANFARTAHGHALRAAQ
jgi:pimeloyl-ACP methyl ester carboxylesterase